MSGGGPDVSVDAGCASPRSSLSRGGRGRQCTTILAVGEVIKQITTKLLGSGEPPGVPLEAAGKVYKPFVRVK